MAYRAPGHRTGAGVFWGTAAPNIFSFWAALVVVVRNSRPCTLSGSGLQHCDAAGSMLLSHQFTPVVLDHCVEAGWLVSKSNDYSFTSQAQGFNLGTTISWIHRSTEQFMPDPT